jgi:hypothetical protein
LLDTKVGQSKKDDPVDVAQAGYEAIMNGEGDVVNWIQEQSNVGGRAIHSIRNPGRTA